MMKKKTIAFYLPQFHAIPENDKWWEKDFTEWTNVKRSRPQFRGHYQPEVPLDDNYYSLLDSKTQEWQSELAEKYGIYGFCYYHYWFNGKLLLEKPMEMMLKNKRINTKFCISWANESWTRTWDGREKDVLIKQNYGYAQEDWHKHFMYLLQFFKDDRYIKISNRPMFIIYKPFLFDAIDEMMDYWNSLAREYGFDGIYYGYQHHLSFENSTAHFDFGICFEPYYTLWEIGHKRMVEYYIKHPLKLSMKMINRFQSYNIVDYDMIWDRIISRENGCRIYAGAFTSWDNTPRRCNKATIFYGATPEKFYHYMKELQKKDDQNEFIFINAWNEWAEGAHLEPDERNTYKYLDALRKSMMK